MYYIRAKCYCVNMLLCLIIRLCPPPKKSEGAREIAYWVKIAISNSSVVLFSEVYIQVWSFGAICVEDKNRRCGALSSCSEGLGDIKLS